MKLFDRLFQRWQRTQVCVFVVHVGKDGKECSPYTYTFTYKGKVPSFKSIQAWFEQSRHMKSNMKVQRVCLKQDEAKVSRELGHVSLKELFQQLGRKGLL